MQWTNGGRRRLPTQTSLRVVVFFWGPHHFDLKASLNEPVKMKGWVFAANTNLPEVLMAAAMFERTVPTSKGVHFVKIFSCIGAVLKLTHTHTPIPVSLRSDTAARKKSKHILSRIHSHAHASFFSTALYCWGAFKLHVMSVTLLEMPIDGGKDCLFAFKQVTTHTAQFYVFGYHWYVFPQFVRLNRKQSSMCTVMSNQQLPSSVKCLH